jgi:hypothetical protein
MRSRPPRPESLAVEGSLSPGVGWGGTPCRATSPRAEPWSSHIASRHHARGIEHPHETDASSETTGAPDVPPEARPCLCFRGVALHIML